jgi:predicted aspartyl protease
MLVDTGASVTVLNKKIFEKLPPSSKSLLSPVKLNLVTATGETSAFIGKLSVDIKIENKYFSQSYIC